MHPEREQQVSFLADLIGQTVRAADCEGKIAYPGIAPGANFIRQRIADQVAATFIKRDENGSIGYSRQNGLTLTLLVGPSCDRRFPADRPPNGVAVDNVRKDRARRRAASGRRR